MLTLVADGRTNRQVGSELFISEKTVSVHLSRVMAKLGAASRTEAVSLAYSPRTADPTCRVQQRLTGVTPDSQCPIGHAFGHRR